MCPPKKKRGEARDEQGIPLEFDLRANTLKEM